MTTDTTRALLEQALEALEAMQSYAKQERKGLRICDETIEAIRAEMARPVEPSYTATQLAAMVLSDCGISTDCTTLHERVARRIALHEEQLIDGLQKLAEPPTPAWHDAPTCPGLWLCDEGDDNPYRWTTHPVSFPHSPLLIGENERWYGPICEDEAIAKAEGGAG